MPALRNRIRSVSLQTLFEADFVNKLEDIDFILNRYDELLKEEGIAVKDSSFGREILKGVISKHSEYDKIINEISIKRTIDKFTILDRNILRIATYEILFLPDEVPTKVAINEAIELADKFSNSASKKFVNGILGRLIEIISENPEKKASIEASNPKKIKKSIGVLVFRHDVKEDELYFVLIKDLFGKWTMPKCSVIESEMLFDSVVRVAKLELGIGVIPEEEIGYNSYIAHPPEGSIRKEVVYFTAKTNDTEITAGESEGIVEAKWFTYNAIVKLSLYKDLRLIILKAIERLYEKNSRKN